MIASADLIRHPATDCDPIRRIGAEISRERDAITLSCRIEGAVSRLRIPGAGPVQRADDLWQHCCFEAFLQAAGSKRYLEFNFSPSGAWAAYCFAGRRWGRESPELTAPQMEVRHGPDWLAMNIQLSLAGVAEFAGSIPISAGLTAVIEDEHGGLSYWAVAHGAPRPDFHDPATFALRLPA
ncbi:MAG: DOMON-like domain-containing protein [Gammaproteobacteria bacterium]|nr:DOMON-like domain-containing protein [Gammaproteobacteria bacterium]